MSQKVPPSVSVVDLIAQAVIDRLDEEVEEEALLDQVIARVRAWQQESALYRKTALDYEQALANENYKEKLCFTTSLNKGFELGGRGLIRSIRKFYSPDQADIIIFIERDMADFARFCADQGAQVQYFDEISEWVLPLVYADPHYAGDARHFYHPDFRPAPHLPYRIPRQAGFGTIRHLHPLNVKAYCTGYCLCICNYRRVVHIDADAFLLAPVDEMFRKHPEPNTVIGFDDGDAELGDLDALLGVAEPEEFNEQFGFNAGIMFYVNGRGVKELARDFMFYIESCYHYDYTGPCADQSVLRAVVAKHAILGGIHFHQEEAVNWNPTWRRVDELQFDENDQRWINLHNSKLQHIWHAAGQEKVWTGRHVSPSINSAWQWVGGEYEN
jgi:hypothetical protein